MVDIKRVPIISIFESENFEKLAELYEEEGKISEINIDVNIDKEAYIKLEEIGMLDCLGCYDKELLVGFMVLITVNVLHYSMVTTTIESQFIAEKYRKYGTWKRMVSIAEDIAKSKNSFAMVMSSAIGTRFEKVANRSGYRATNIMYTKSLI